MTNDQCIEVAEKVWGWKWVPGSTSLVGTWFDENRQPLRRSAIQYQKDVITEYVNSWAGFGRTVEAMADRHQAHLEVWYSEEHGQDELTFCDAKLNIPIRWNGLIPTELIEATHLAALEALK